MSPTELARVEQNGSRSVVTLVIKKSSPYQPERCKFYRAVVRPTLIYGSECPAVKNVQEQRMWIAEMRMHRFRNEVFRKDRSRNEYIRTRVGMANILGRKWGNIKYIGSILWCTGVESRGWTEQGSTQVHLGAGGEDGYSGEWDRWDLPFVADRQAGLEGYDSQTQPCHHRRDKGWKNMNCVFWFG